MVDGTPAAVYLAHLPNHHASGPNQIRSGRESLDSGFLPACLILVSSFTMPIPWAREIPESLHTQRAAGGARDTFSPVECQRSYLQCNVGDVGE